MQPNSAKNFIIKEKKVHSKPASANEKKQKKIKQGNLAVQLLISIIAGVLTALLGGVVWGLIAILTGHIFMILAMGIGGICGHAVAIFADEKNKIGFQIIAVFSSILGIVTGKYISFFYTLRKILTNDFSIFDMFTTDLFSEKLIRIYAENITSMIGFLDIMFILMAVIIACAMIGHPMIYRKIVL